MLGHIAIGHRICVCRDCGNDSSDTRKRKRQERGEVEEEIRSEMADRIFTAREAMELGRALRQGKPATFRPRYWR